MEPGHEPAAHDGAICRPTGEAVQDTEALRTLFDERLRGDVTITYFTQHESKLIVPRQECDLCAETRELLQEVADLSEKLHLEVMDFVSDEETVQEMGHAPSSSRPKSAQEVGKWRSCPRPERRRTAADGGRLP
jgi:hypothetical protein